MLIIKPFGTLDTEINQGQSIKICTIQLIKNKQYDKLIKNSSIKIAKY